MHTGCIRQINRFYEPVITGHAAPQVITSDGVVLAVYEMWSPITCDNCGVKHFSLN